HQFETTNNLKEINNEFEENGKDPYTSICDSKVTLSLGIEHYYE
ncbi:867_t:CDS:1, partial [Gigaspora rosea]